MLIAALFAVAETWKQPRSPSVNGWIKTLGTLGQWDTYYSEFKINRQSSQEKTRRKFKCVFK